MGVDLKLANRVWRAAQAWAKSEGLHSDVDYSSALVVVCALLNDKELAQEIVLEAWSDEEPSSVPGGAPTKGHGSG